MHSEADRHTVNRVGDLVAPDEAGLHATIGTRLGTPDVIWRTDPTSLTFPDVANVYLSHRIAVYLRRLGINAGQLAQACGGADSAWRNKLTGWRPFQLIDLIKIAAAIDTTVLEVVAEVDRPEDLVPPAHRSYVRAERGRLPVFVQPSIAWPAVVEAVASWQSSELDAGRGWALTRDVLVHRVLSEVDKAGLSSPAAAGEHRDRVFTLNWLAASVSIHVFWDSPDVTPDPAGLVRILAALGQAVWGVVDETRSATTILLAAVPVSVSANFLSVCDRPPAGDSELRSTWFTLSLPHAHRLGVPSADSLPDIHIQVLSHRSSALLALAAKA